MQSYFFQNVVYPKQIMSDVGSNFEKSEHRTSNSIIIPSPEQLTVRSMHQIHKVYY